MTADSALVLFSGGQDSTVCLAWALARYERIETIGFSYGQRHEIELTQRAVIRSKLYKTGDAARRLGPDTVLELQALKSISNTALTRETEITFAATGLPTTFVPGRNLLFLTYAAALAYRRDIGTLVGGMCETDYSGYPDCRNDTIQALAQALSLGLATPITIETPLMFIDKAGTWKMADELGGLTLIDIIVEDTHTCYLGDRRTRHPWGYGCGTCPACELRAKGWATWQAREDLKRAVALALAGQWDAAHRIAQLDDADPLACWLHAVLHKIEGDGSNSRYWYRRAGRRFEDFADTRTELEAVRAALRLTPALQSASLKGLKSVLRS